MEYKNFQTFSVEVKNAIAWVTFDFGPVNVQGQEMLADLNSLALRLERDRSVKVVVFQSANPEICSRASLLQGQKDQGSCIHKWSIFERQPYPQG